MNVDQQIEPLGLSQYTPIARIGAGGQAEIILAIHHGDGGFERPVVIKRLWPHVAADPKSRGRLVQEAQLVAQIRHPGVCQVQNLIDGRDGPLLVLEYLEGITVGMIIRRLPETRSIEDIRFIVACMQQAAEGLHHAHNVELRDGSPGNLVHGDVSANNILVTREGVAKVLDFGLARAGNAERSMSLRGTAPFMSPEQLKEIELDRRSDIFSLAILVYESLTGRGLFRRKTRAETFQAIMSDEAPRFRESQPNVPEGLEAAVLRALAKNRDDRHATAQAFGQAMVESLAAAGGPMRLSEVADYLQRNFVDILSARQRRVAAVVEAHANTGLARQPTHETEAITDPGDRVWQDESLHALPAVDLAPSPSPSPSRDRRKIWPYLILLAVLAAGTFGVLEFVLTGDDPDTELAGPAIGDDPDTELAGPASVPASPDAAPPVDASQPPADAMREVDAALAKPPEKTPPKSSKADNRNRTSARGKPGFFTVDSRPFARIRIDGKDRGRAPLYRLRLPAGKHKVRATLSDGRSKSFSINVRPGEELKKRIRW